MQRRVIIFMKGDLENFLPVVFAIFNETVVLDLGNMSLNEFASKNSLIRHESYDAAAGDFGSRCVLMERNRFPGKLIHDVQLEDGKALSVKWLNFPCAVKVLFDGTDKRYLQLAVQYISAGGVDESVIAADYDDEFLHHLMSKLPGSEHN